MKIAAHRNGKWARVCLTMFLLSFGGPAVAAQTQHKPSAKSSPREKEDPLQPLLVEAKDDIDKMDFAAAIEPLQKYIAERPDIPYAHFQLAYAYTGLKRVEEARAEYSRAVALDPKMAAAYLNLGLVLMESDPSAAADAFRHVVELQPTESRPRFLAGLALEHAGKFPEAIEQYRGALALSPNDYEAHFSLGRALIQTRDAAGAEGQFQQAVALRGDSVAARLGLANSLLAQKKYDAASDALAEYLKLKPGDAAAHFDRASALLNLDRYDDALAELERSDGGATSPADLMKMRGEIYIRQKKWKEARETLAQALVASPKDLEASAWLGHADIELKDYAAAVKILRSVYAQNPQDAVVLRDLTNALFLNEDYPSALEAMDNLAKLEPPAAGSWFIRAICYDKLSRVVDAIEAYQKFLDMDNEQHANQDIEARHRKAALEKELKLDPKLRKK